MIELKPCPGCGGEFIKLHKERDKYRYECDFSDCWITTDHWYLTEEEAAAAWNNLKMEELEATTDELKPCPFCGGEAEYYGECDMVKVRCSTYDCGCELITWFDNPEEAATEWNRRAES